MEESSPEVVTVGSQSVTSAHPVDGEHLRPSSIMATTSASKDDAEVTGQKAAHSTLAFLQSVSPTPESPLVCHLNGPSSIQMDQNIPVHLHPESIHQQYLNFTPGLFAQEQVDTLTETVSTPQFGVSPEEQPPLASPEAKTSHNRPTFISPPPTQQSTIVHPLPPTVPAVSRHIFPSNPLPITGASTSTVPTASTATQRSISKKQAKADAKKAKRDANGAAKAGPQPPVTSTTTKGASSTPKTSHQQAPKLAISKQTAQTAPPPRVISILQRPKKPPVTVSTASTSGTAGLLPRPLNGPSTSVASVPEQQIINGPSTSGAPAGPLGRRERRKRPTEAQLSRMQEIDARNRVESTFRSYIQNPKMTVQCLLKSPQDARFLMDHLSLYMNFLRRRLADPEVTYLEIADKHHDDYAFYEERLLTVMSQLGLFTEEVRSSFGDLIAQYRRLHPPSIWKFRARLLDIREAVIGMPDFELVQGGAKKPGPGPLNPRMVTYAQVNPVELHKSLLVYPDSRDQLEYFLSQIGLSPEGSANLDAFITALRSALDNSPLKELAVKVHPFGSLSNGLGTYDSDLDIVLQFKKVLSDKDRLDYETGMLILKVIRLLLPKKLGFRPADLKNLIVPSKRCPIIKLDFEQCCPEFRWIKDQRSRRPGERPLAFNKCDISVTSIYGVHNSKMLKFFTDFDRRFYEMALLLKYWAKKNGLINTEGFSSYAFVMMIIYFLQTRQPAILPSIAMLQELAHRNSAKYYSVRVHKWNFEFCDDSETVRKEMKSEMNSQTTMQLLTEFFQFALDFDYLQQAISVRIGGPVTKEALFTEKATQGLEYAFKRTIVVIEDPFVLEHNPGSIFHEHYMPKWRKTLTDVLEKWSVNEGNVIAVLTDPTKWDPSPPPREFGGRDSKESKEVKKRLEKVQEEMAKLGREVEKANRSVQMKNAEDGKENAQSKEMKSEGNQETDKEITKAEELNHEDSQANGENGHTEEANESFELLDTTDEGTSGNEQMDGRELPKGRIPIDYKMVTYRKVDQRRLNETIKTLSGREQVETFLESVQLSGECRADTQRFVDAVSEAMASTEAFATLKPRLVLVGSLASGLALYNADINLVVYFDVDEIPPELLADFENAKTALKLIISLFHHKLGFEKRPMRREKCSVPCRKRAILSLNFSTVLKVTNPEPLQRKFNRCDVSCGLTYAEAHSGLLQTLTAIDGRFRELLLILKFWAKQNGFINQDLYKQCFSFSSYAFTLLVVFYCQNTVPAILPKISLLFAGALPQAASEEQSKSSSSLWAGRYSLNYRTDFGQMVPLNGQTIQELAVGFFHYFATFNYDVDAICVRSGTKVTKKSLYMEKSAQNRMGFKRTDIVIEDPIIHEMNVGDGQDRRRWTAALGQFLNEYAMTPENCLDLLTNPDLFGPGFSPRGKQVAQAAGPAPDDGKDTEVVNGAAPPANNGPPPPLPVMANNRNTDNVARQPASEIPRQVNSSGSYNWRKHLKTGNTEAVNGPSPPANNGPPPPPIAMANNRNTDNVARQPASEIPRQVNSSGSYNWRKHLKTGNTEAVNGPAPASNGPPAPPRGSSSYNWRQHLKPGRRGPKNGAQISQGAPAAASSTKD